MFWTKVCWTGMRIPEISKKLSAIIPYYTYHTVYSPVYWVAYVEIAISSRKRTTPGRDADLEHAHIHESFIESFPEDSLKNAPFGTAPRFKDSMLAQPFAPRDQGYLGASGTSPRSRT